MIEITLNNKNYLLVEVPEDGKNYKVGIWSDNSTTLEFQSDTFKMDYDSYEINVSEKNQLKEITLSMNSIKTKLIGKISDILKDEDICKELVEFYDYKASNKWFTELIMWKDYNFQLNEEEVFDFDYARDSFLSWTQSINLDLSKNWILIKKL